VVDEAAERLRAARDRAHLLSGLRAGQQAWRAALECVASAASGEDAVKALGDVLGLDETQALAFLDMQVRRLLPTERDRIDLELEGLRDELGDREA
jgi:DNA gyrase/topoisomerase IV subunit A